METADIPPDRVLSDSSGRPGDGPDIKAIRSRIKDHTLDLITQVEPGHLSAQVRIKVISVINGGSHQSAR